MSPTEQDHSKTDSPENPVRLIYQVGDFRFCTMPLTLTRRGRQVKVRPQSLRLLELLLASIGLLVPTATAIDYLWPGGGGDEKSLRVTMAHLRAALARPGESAIFVETVRGQGYRFVHPVEISTQDLVIKGSARKSWFGA